MELLAVDKLVVGMFFMYRYGRCLYRVHAVQSNVVYFSCLWPVKKYRLDLKKNRGLLVRLSNSWFDKYVELVMFEKSMPF